MDTRAIRDSIALARQHEAEQRQLYHLLKAHWPRVRGAVRLPRKDPASHLCAFVIAYIEHVPDCLEAADAITREARIDGFATPLLQLATDFFPGGETAPATLIELMTPAYLAHRLLEEVNDRFMARTGTPLVPIDTTMASLIVHSLIGEPFANELDDAVQFSLAQLAEQEEALCNSAAFKAYAAAHRGDHWTLERERWPCLGDQLGVDISFGLGP